MASNQVKQSFVRPRDEASRRELAAAIFDRLWFADAGFFFGGSSYSEAWENFVRPWQGFVSRSRIRPIPAEERDHGPAFFEWGGPSQFEGVNTFRSLSRQVSFGEGDGDPDPVPTFTFSEINRQQSDVRITNPDDPEDFVIVKRASSIQFNGPDGKYVFNYQSGG